VNWCARASIRDRVRIRFCHPVEAAQDGVVLTAEVIRIENKAIADIEVFLNTVGGFPANSTNTAQYVISVKNNGDGTGTGAFATGFASPAQGRVSRRKRHIAT